MRKERTTPVLPVWVDLICETCDVPMVATGVTFPTAPMKYEHRCPNCRQTLNVVGKTYPFIRHDPS